MNDTARGITIYCGSCEGRDPRFAESARIVGAEIARRGFELVYGGGHMGLMGAAAKAAREAGGATCAVIPGFMVDRGWNDPDSSRTIITPDMHTRKRTMASMARGVIALPGGVGTFEELAEIITWRQLGLYGGNIVILDVARYYAPLLAQIDAAVEAGFLPADHRSLFTVTENPAVAVAFAAACPAAPSLHKKF